MQKDGTYSNESMNRTCFVIRIIVICELLNIFVSVISTLTSNTSGELYLIAIDGAAPL